MLSDNVSISIISTIGGIVVTFLTVKYKDKIINRRTSKNHRYRMDSIFDGYERLILQLTADMDRKENSISRMEGIIDGLEEELNKTKQLLNETKLELHQSQKQKHDLSKQLHEMRKDYESRVSSSK